MKLYIPSRGRAHRAKTLGRLPESLRENTTLVVPPSEVRDYETLGVSVLGCPVDGITPTRDFILKEVADEDKIVMLDDDLIFQRRREDGRITDCSEVETEEAFAWLDNQLDEVAHAGFGARFLGYAAEGPYIEVGRLMYVLGYNVPACREAGVSFGKGLPEHGTMEDFNITLQLLLKGYPNRISLEWRCSPGQSNAVGGCSVWRTTEKQSDSARRLAIMYPGIVTIRQKKEWKGMDQGMYDVRVAWQKAFKQYLEAANV